MGWMLEVWWLPRFSARVELQSKTPAEAREEALRVAQEQARNHRSYRFLKRGEIRHKGKRCCAGWLIQPEGIPAKELLSASRPEEVFDWSEEVGV